jgi:glycosyltransferase involved in cell wall biosynthesis
MKISAVVVTYNEEKILEDCLKALRAYDQLLVVDLGSTDRSLEIAQRYATEVFQHKHEPIVEFVVPEIIDRIKNEWYIRVDPDEILPPSLLDDITCCIEEHPDVAIVKIPLEYYFLGKPLGTTVWGGIRYFPKVLHKNRTIFYKRVHGRVETREKFTIRQVNYNGHNVVKHYWIDSFEMLREKHLRYLKLEGKSRFERGLRFSWFRWLYSTFKALLVSLVQKNGWRGGWTGWFLSFYYSSYEMRAWLSLRSYEKETRAGKTM